MTIVITSSGTPTAGSGFTYLQLAQKLRIKCRVSGSGPSAVTGQSAEYQRLLDWINEAYLDILGSHEKEWFFLRKSAGCLTVQGQGQYDPAVDFGLSDFGQWALDSGQGRTFRCYPSEAGPVGEQFLDVIAYDEWRDRYQFGAFRSTYARPMEVAVGPGFQLCVGPIAQSGYTLVGDYFQIPAPLVDAADLPVIPAQYQMAIVYRAMMLYGVSEAAPEVYADGQNNFNVWIRRLEATQLPAIGLPGSLC